MTVSEPREFIVIEPAAPSGASGLRHALAPTHSRLADGESRRLTDMQAAFVVAFTTVPNAIGNAAASARLAGYSENSAKELGRRLVDLPHVQAAIREANQQQISGQMATKAIALLGRVIEDESVPMKTRVDAARTILDRAGYSALPPAAPKRLTDKTMSEMTADELRETMRLARAEMDKAAQGAIVIEQTACVAEPLPPLADTAGES